MCFEYEVCDGTLHIIPYVQHVRRVRYPLHQLDLLAGSEQCVLQIREKV